MENGKHILVGMLYESKALVAMQILYEVYIVFAEFFIWILRIETQHVIYHITNENI